jgi:hypothetical protein
MSTALPQEGLCPLFATIFGRDHKILIADDATLTAFAGGVSALKLNRS